MIKSIHITNYTVFKEAELTFGKRLNVILGENGTGKTHLLNLLYAMHMDWRNDRPLEEVWQIEDPVYLFKNKRKELQVSMETDEGFFEISANKECTLIPKLESKTPALYLIPGFDVKSTGCKIELREKSDPKWVLSSSGEVYLSETQESLSQLPKNSILLIDCPECYLDPKGIRKIVQFLKELKNVQIFVTTNSLFMMYELNIEFHETRGIRWFNLLGKKGVQQGDTQYEIGDVSLVDENMRQSDQYILGDY